MTFVRILSLPILFYLLVFIVGCKNNGGIKNDSTIVSYMPIDSLTLKLTSLDTFQIKDFLIGDYTDYQVISDSEKDILIGINARDHGLDFIDLTNKVSQKQIKFQSYGPDGILGQIDGFYYHNPDTIFVLTIDENRIYVMTEGGEKIDYYDFNNIPLPDGFDNYDVYADIGIQNGPYYNVKNRTLQFYTYRWLSGRKNDFSFKTFASYSIEDKEFKSIYGNYPEVYKRGRNYLIYNDPSLVVVDSLSYVFFGVSDLIYCYNNNNGELLNIIKHHCEHWRGTPDALKITADFQQGEDWLVSNSAYVFLLHDDINDQFFRFLKHEQPVSNLQGLINPRWLGEWCIEIFNQAMKPVGHYEIAANTLLPAMSFVNDGKMWIKNPTPRVLENQSLYYQFKIDEKN